MILMHSALPIQYPRRFIVIIFKKDNRSPVDRDQVTKIQCISNYSIRAISPRISTSNFDFKSAEYLKLFFEKIETGIFCTK